MEQLLEMRKKLLTVRMSEEESATLDRVAKARGKSASDTIRQLIDEAARVLAEEERRYEQSNQRKAWEIAERTRFYIDKSGLAALVRQVVARPEDGEVDIVTLDGRRQPVVDAADAFAVIAGWPGSKLGEVSDKMKWSKKDGDWDFEREDADYMAWKAKHQRPKTGPKKH